MIEHRVHHNADAHPMRFLYQFLHIGKTSKLRVYFSVIPDIVLVIRDRLKDRGQIDRVDPKLL